MNAQAQAQKAAANANKMNNVVTTSNMTPVNITSMSMATIASNSIDTNAIKTELTTTNCSTDDILQQIQQQQQVLQLQSDCQTICLHVSTEIKWKKNICIPNRSNLILNFDIEIDTGAHKWQFSSNTSSNQTAAAYDNQLGRHNKHRCTAANIECNFYR